MAITETIVPADRIIKLARYLREGAALRPQAFGRFFDWDGEQICSCALGAIAEGFDASALPVYQEGFAFSPAVPTRIIGDLFEGLSVRAEYLSPEMLMLMNAKRKAASTRYSLWMIVSSLNDTLRWTREMIADLLEELAHAGKVSVLETDF